MKVPSDSPSGGPSREQRAALLWLLALVLLSVAGLVWNTLGMNETLVIDGLSAYPVRATDDRDPGNHGSSVARLERDGRSLSLQCEVGMAATYPFCEMHFTLAPPPAGIDLSQFSVMRIRVDATGPEPLQEVRVSLGNFNPAYSRPGNVETLKNHELVYIQQKRHGLIEVPMDRMSVASWWIEEHNVPLEYAGTELQHVVALDIVTGANLRAGPHRIVVDRIELERKLVSPATFRLGLLLVWLAAVSAFVAVQLITYKAQLRESRRQERVLAQTITSLNARSESLETMARSDPATGLLNRAGLKLGLEQRLLRFGLRQFPMAVIFVDIDHFKRINDSLGHATGDAVIAQVAAHLRNDVTHDDLVARWGGEEFLLLCPGTGGDEARRIAERLRQGVERQTWPSGMDVTCSFGITVLAAGEDWLQAIERADAAMYQAKQAGRNRVVVSAAA
ncbi:MAG TPA: GGDEF domain-containing protein [Burkholderiaceae bacterium]